MPVFQLKTVARFLCLTVYNNRKYRYVGVAGRRMTDTTRNSSGDEIANVNFLYDDIVHVLQNTIDLCIISATD